MAPKGNEQRRDERQERGENVEDGCLGEEGGAVEALQRVAEHGVHLAAGESFNYPWDVSGLPFQNRGMRRARAFFCVKPPSIQFVCFFSS